jgi:hypothetical protein
MIKAFLKKEKRYLATIAVFIVILLAAVVFHRAEINDMYTTFYRNTITLFERNKSATHYYLSAINDLLLVETYENRRLTQDEHYAVIQKVNFFNVLFRNTYDGILFFVQDPTTGVNIELSIAAGVPVPMWFRINLSYESSMELEYFHQDLRALILSIKEVFERHQFYLQRPQSLFIHYYATTHMQAWANFYNDLRSNGFLWENMLRHAFRTEPFVHLG